MRTVHIGIGHNDNLVVAKLADIKVVAVSLRKTASKGIDHGLDLGIGKDFVNAGFFYIQNLASNRQDGLEMAVSGGFGRTAGRISFDNKDLADIGIAAFAVGQFAVGVKGEFLLGQQVGTWPFPRSYGSWLLSLHRQAQPSMYPDSCQNNERLLH